MDISFQDDSFAASSAPSETPASSEKGKSKPARDPETNQTYDTIRKRKMVGRYETMMKEQGLAYRVNGVQRLTQIQAGSMIHRNQKHIDAVDVSEEVMSVVFDHRADKQPCIKRGEKLVADQERLIKMYEELYAEQNQDEIGDEGRFDYVGKLEDVFQLLESDPDNEKSVELIQTTDKWLAKIQGSLEMLKKESEMSLKLFDRDPTYVFDDLKPVSARCRPFDFAHTNESARCRPFKPANKNEPIVDETEQCARCRPIDIINRRPIRNYNAAQMEISNDVFRQLNYTSHSLEDQVAFSVEAMGLRFEPDTDEEDEDEDDLKTPTQTKMVLVVKTRGKIGARK